jgi:translation elongation factor EF-Tu-like GTPase
MHKPLPEAREVSVVKGLFTADETSRGVDLVQSAIRDSRWQVEIRTAKVVGQVVRKSSLGGFRMSDCICIDLKLDRAVPVEPGLRFRIVSELDPTLTATGVVRPWD